MTDKEKMEKVEIFCNLCGARLASVPSKFQAKYSAALCRGCREAFHQRSSEIDLTELRKDLRKLQA